MINNPRQLAFLTLRDLERRGIFADIALDKWLRQAELTDLNRRLATELVYGCVRRKRSLDALIDQFAKKKSHQQPPDLRIILHLGFYQLCFLNQVSAAAVVHTTVELVKQNKLSGLTGFVNGVLRQYLRVFGDTASDNHPLKSVVEPLKNNPEKLGILYSFPNWIIQLWLQQLGETETEQLCQWFNQSPTIDLRINPLKTTLETVENDLKSAGLTVSRVPHLPQALRLTGSVGNIQKLPGYDQGWWMVQDSSAQFVSHLLNPKPGEVVMDVCAAPGGKTTHLAELMQDQGTILAFDSVKSRLKKLEQNINRLQLQSIQTQVADIRQLETYNLTADRVLLDAPCSGLGTLHRRADARWKHSPENIQELSQLQAELLEKVANWVKPGGYLVYATCTLHPLENEGVIQSFLSRHEDWKIDTPDLSFPEIVDSEGWMKVWPHRHNMDGFFIVRLKRQI